MYKLTDTCILNRKQMNELSDTFYRASEKIKSLTKLNEELQFVLQKEKALVALLKREQEFTIKDKQ